MRSDLLIVVAAAFVLAGYVAPTSYRSSVSVTSVDAGTIRIVAQGNTYTAPSTLDDYVKLKAAEETLARGYDGFEVIDENDQVKEGYEVVGPAVLHVQVPLAQMPVHDFTETVTIKMFKGPEPENPPHTWFDAKDTKKRMEARIAAQ